ncbi:MAG: cobyric acid synthase [Lautropia sp.]|nr:cobyric acid synthase [Lautropia sp.]
MKLDDTEASPPVGEGSPVRLARCVMVLGTTSGAGKSWLCTALCRWYARQGLRVAPFKAQNMSNNARVVAGGEIGSAQYFQALAAGVEPTVQMNPLLLKPEADTRSQVILLGRISEELTAMPWRARHRHTWPVIASTLDALRRQYDVIVIEGAGSPAEINLRRTDVVNMRVARHVQAACLLVADIDRGGAFAHLYGTWALMPEEDRRLLRGFVLNRFRGDATLLAPAPQMIEEMTGVPVVATVPMWIGHGLPEEDGWFQYRDRQCTEDRSMDTDPFVPGVDIPMSFDGKSSFRRAHVPLEDTLDQGRVERLETDAASVIGHATPSSVPFSSSSGEAASSSEPRPVSMTSSAMRARVHQIILIAPPRISNLDEFEPLSALRGVRLMAVRDGTSLPAISDCDWIILPGSKHTSSDLAWVKRQGIDDWVRSHAARGGAVLGICGGLQMLGERLVDEHGVDGSADGIGLLPLLTSFGRDKVLRRRSECFGVLPDGPWSALSGMPVGGYEIHQGRTEQMCGKAADVGTSIGERTLQTQPDHDVMPGSDPCCTVDGVRVNQPSVRGVLPDGLGWCNASGNVLGVCLHGLFENDAVLTALFGQRARPIQTVFDGLADHLEASFDTAFLSALLLETTE